MNLTTAQHISSVPSAATKHDVVLMLAAVNIGVAVGAFVFQKLKQSSGPALLSGGLTLFALGYMGMAVSVSIFMTTTSAVVASFGAGLWTGVCFFSVNLSRPSLPQPWSLLPKASAMCSSFMPRAVWWAA